MKTELPILYALSSTKKVKMWSIAIEETEEGTANIITSHGYLGAKIQTNYKEITKGKNLGKKNATTPYTQAVSDAQSSWNKKKDSQYIETIPDKDFVPDVRLPMLAQTFNDRKHKIVYPAIAQPKLNGVRCLAKKISDTEIRYLSRKGKTFADSNDTLAHLTEDLIRMLDVGEEVDGEIFHPEWTFQEILRNVKKLRATSTQLQYWLYDVAVEDVTFDDRLFTLTCMVASSEDMRIVRVNNHTIADEEDVYIMHREFIRQGFEGVIIRNKEGLYKYDHRSVDLQKYKEFIDEEFEIIGATEGKGLDKGCVIFKVLNKEERVLSPKGVDFSVKPKGTREYRQYVLKNMDEFMGKELTVRYQELSEENVPIFPVGIAVRDYE